MMHERVLLILGDDKLGRRCYEQLQLSRGIFDNVDLALDRSSSFSRVVRLVGSGRLPLQCVMRMAWAEFCRHNALQISDAIEINSNGDLRELILDNSYVRVLLFRAGLIISGEVLSLGVPFHNVHCASIPEYAGLCSIWRALRDECYHQQATLHVVTKTIDDSSQVLATESYEMSSKNSYAINEDKAYAAGITLLRRVLEREIS